MPTVEYQKKSAMNDTHKQSGLVAELARRRVFRAAGAYIVVSWVVVQVGATVFPEFGAPTWAMRALMILLIVGFPPAMLLAWTLDISGKGFERTPDSRYSRV
jgi:adenylate cyclase